MYIFAHFVVLFLPGLLFCVAVRILRPLDMLAVSFAVSFIKIVLLIGICKILELSIVQFLLVWLLMLGVSGWWALRSGLPSFRSDFEVRYEDRWDLIAVLSLVLIISVYFSVVGPYLEVPSDVFAHLEYAQGAGVDLSDGVFTYKFPMAIFHGPGNDSWYYLFTLLLKTTSTDFRSALQQASVSNVITLIIVLYAFSHRIFESQTNRTLRSTLALLSCAIFFVSFGTNIFAFVRYYALAPTILNMALFFSVTAILLRYVRHSGVPASWLIFVTVAMGVAWLVHEQETLFIFIIGLCLALYATVVRLFGSIGRSGSRSGADPYVDAGQFAVNTPPAEFTPALSASRLERILVPWTLLAGIGTIGLIAAVVYSHVTLDRYVVPDSKLLSIQSFLPTTRDLYILNPMRQFYQTIALSGVVVYGLSLFFHRAVRSHPYLLIGMLSPILTVFNPFFADFFLRHSAPESFWRFCYLIPTAFVCSLILVTAIKDVMNQRGMRRAGAALAIVGLVVCMVLPARSDQFSSWTRWPTLAAVDAGNGVDQWQDLIERVAQMDTRTRLYTDPVTGYLLTGMTTAQSRRKKFHRYPHDELSLRYLTEKRLSKHGKAVLIINLRDGSPSKNGGLSRHWPEQITQTSAYYRPELMNFVADNPQLFQEIWQQDRIRIYRITTDSD